MAACNKEGKNENRQGGKKKITRNHSWIEKIYVSSSENRFALSKVHHELMGDIPKITVPSELMASLPPMKGSSAGSETTSKAVKDFTAKQWTKPELETGTRKEEGYNAIDIHQQPPSFPTKIQASDIAPCSKFAGGNPRDISSTVSKTLLVVTHVTLHPADQVFLPNNLGPHAARPPTSADTDSNLHSLPLLGRKAKKAKRKKRGKLHVKLSSHHMKFCLGTMHVGACSFTLTNHVEPFHATAHPCMGQCSRECCKHVGTSSIHANWFPAASPMHTMLESAARQPLHACPRSQPLHLAAHAAIHVKPTFSGHTAYKFAQLRLQVCPCCQPLHSAAHAAILETFRIPHACTIGDVGFHLFPYNIFRAYGPRCNARESSTVLAFQQPMDHLQVLTLLHSFLSLSQLALWEFAKWWAVFKAQSCTCNCFTYGPAEGPFLPYGPHACSRASQLTDALVFS